MRVQGILMLLFRVMVGRVEIFQITVNLYRGIGHSVIHKTNINIKRRSMQMYIFFSENAFGRNTQTYESLRYKMRYNKYSNIFRIASFIFAPLIQSIPKKIRPLLLRTETELSFISGNVNNRPRKRQRLVQI